jgi:L-lysine exporter family protein LysE/ArgO
MISTLGQGFILGLAYAMPIGAQNLFVIQSASSRSLAQGFIIASLVILNDIALAGVCFLGVGHLFVLNEIVRQFMIGCSSIILAVLAFKTLRTAMVSRTSFIGDNRDASNNVNFSTLNIFLTATSLTWLNPQALLDGTLLLGSYRASFSNVHLAYVFFLGVCIASMTWFTALTCAVMFLAKRGDKSYLRAAQFGLAFMLILLSFSMLTQLFETASAAVTDTTRTVRIAILDNLKSEKLASERYVEEYLRGINLAVREAGKTKIALEPKLFLYDSKPLEILAMLPEVLAWHPDVIIGPRSSDQFMLLKDRLSNIAVISPAAAELGLYATLGPRLT